MFIFLGAWWCLCQLFILFIYYFNCRRRVMKYWLIIDPFRILSPSISYPENSRLFGQWLVARRDSGVMEFYYRQSRSQSPLAFWSAGGRQERYGYGTGIFFRIIQSLSWRPPADQNVGGLWVRD